jgi:magnesium-transporting ATPase (P-type)
MPGAPDPGVGEGSAGVVDEGPRSPREPWLLPGAEVAVALATDPARGLSPAEAARRLGRGGANRIESLPKPAAWRRVAGQLRSADLPAAGRFPLAIGVLQVLALDIGTDVLPALALGAEPPSEHVLDRRPRRRHLLDRAIFGRAFGLLGPVEAFVELTAFVVTFIAVGWRPGEAFPEGHTLLIASGAAFTAVVLAQVANAFGCRSTRRLFWQSGLGRNRLLLMAIVAELGMLAAFLYFPPLAHLLGQAPPSVPGYAVAALGIPVVLAVDTVHKLVLRKRAPLGAHRTAEREVAAPPQELVSETR